MGEEVWCWRKSWGGVLCHKQVGDKVCQAHRKWKKKAREQASPKVFQKDSCAHTKMFVCVCRDSPLSHCSEAGKEEEPGTR